MGKQSNQNRTWDINHDLIQEAYFRLLKQNNRIPTYKLLCQETKLSEPTIEKHLKELDLDKLRPKFKPMIESVIRSLAKNAITSGKAPETKLFLQVIGDWKEKSEHKIELNSISDLFKEDND